MCLPEQLLELVHLRPDDVDPTVAHAPVRSQGKRPAAEHEHVIVRPETRSVEQGHVHFAGGAHRAI